MAEAILKKELKKRFGDEYSLEVTSAGIGARPGDPASPNAVTAMAEKGIDISGHKASLATREMVMAADLILTMTVSHKRAILSLAPEARGKVFTLGEFAGKGEQHEISDPFAGSLDDYRKAAAEIEELLQVAIDKFLKD